jgi:adenylate cyclase
LLACSGLYLDALSRIIQRDTHGTIDKYIGDGIMTIWNAPEPVPDHPQMRASPRYAAATRRDLSHKHPNGANFPPLRHASDCIARRLWLDISARATG